jgi:S-adenosylmethionine:tRNA ribosyltransferase-isomerase
MGDGVWMSDYTYELPENRIAAIPLERRDSAKLLVFRDGKIEHSGFSQLSDFLNVDSLLFFNDTRVIPARLQFTKETGAKIEVLLLSPLDPPLPQESMAAKGRCTWDCIIGNVKRWKPQSTLHIRSGLIELEAALLDKDKNTVEFKWNLADLPFAEILRMVGDTPLPPYIQRATTLDDRDRYQTVYAHHDGAVAAPTAGLHFTAEVQDALKKKGIESDYITLHVSAGTFLPVKTENALEHHMHEEQVVITRQNVLNLLKGKDVVCVGTTSLRTLESLYWFGCLLEKNPVAPFIISQDDPYSGVLVSIDKVRAFENVLKRIGSSDAIHGRTSIFIRPGYTFHVCDSLITNFHQPGSTLLLLVAAFAGPTWKSIYEQALQHGYRFLSYGDSSLIQRSKG